MSYKAVHYTLILVFSFCFLALGLLLQWGLDPRTNSVVETLYASWCRGSREEDALPVPPGLSNTALALSLLAPLAPIFLAETPSRWNDARTRALLGLLAGQSAVYGATEGLRWCSLSISPYFWGLCNITLDQCLARVGETNLAVLPSNESGSEPLCSGSQADPGDLYANLHASPDSRVALLGAALTSFFFSMCQWSSFLVPETKPSRQGRSVEMTLATHSFILISGLALVFVVAAYGVLGPLGPLSFFSSLSSGVLFQTVACLFAHGIENPAREFDYVYHTSPRDRKRGDVRMSVLRRTETLC